MLRRRHLTGPRTHRPRSAFPKRCRAPSKEEDTLRPRGYSGPGIGPCCWCPRFRPCTLQGACCASVPWSGRGAGRACQARHSSTCHRLSARPPHETRPRAAGESSWTSRVAAGRRAEPVNGHACCYLPARVTLFICSITGGTHGRLYSVLCNNI